MKKYDIKKGRLGKVTYKKKTVHNLQSDKEKTGLIRITKLGSWNSWIRKFNKSPQKIVRVALGIGLTIGLGVIFLKNFSVGQFTLADEVFIQDIKYVGNIGWIQRVKCPENLPKFSNSREAIDFVRGLDYNVFVSNPSEVLENREGNCLGKARLLYYIGKQQGFKVEFIKETPTHIDVEVNGEIYDLTVER